jgi:hypothetical protein
LKVGHSDARCDLFDRNVRGLEQVPGPLKSLLSHRLNDGATEMSSEKARKVGATHAETLSNVCGAKRIGEARVDKGHGLRHGKWVARSRFGLRECNQRAEHIPRAHIGAERLLFAP